MMTYEEAKMQIQAIPEKIWNQLSEPDREAMEMAFSALEAQEWIPVSERLPKLDEAVLATTEWNDITIAWRTGIDKWYIHEGNTNSTTDDIIAWMYLPEPYSAERRINEAD